MKIRYVILLAGGCLGLGFMLHPLLASFSVPKSAEAMTLITMIASFITAAATVIVASIAIWAILSQRQTARAQHTISHLAATERDRDIIIAKRIFVDRAKRRGGLAKYAHKERGRVENAICKVLNHYELISLGIQSGIIDCEVFRRWNRSTVLFVWRSAAPFVAEHRKLKGSPLLWHEFEELARAFDANKNPSRKINRLIK